ncbi:hypothetical protein ACFLXQ_05760 [Chloroflexota bacterium]
MKYIRVFMFLMVLVALLIAGCTSAAVPTPAGEPAEAPAAPTEAAAPATDDSPWQVVLNTEIEQSMRMVAFLNESFGLIGGPATTGKVQYTTNGGEIWTRADDTSGT